MELDRIKKVKLSSVVTLGKEAGMLSSSLSPRNQERKLSRTRLQEYKKEKKAIYNWP